MTVIKYANRSKVTGVVSRLLPCGPLRVWSGTLSHIIIAEVFDKRSTLIPKDRPAFVNHTLDILVTGVTRL